MPRPLRLNFKGGWYHVMNRGAARQIIYKTEQHRLMFLNLLREASQYYNIEIHAFCLMDNHYHLLIHTPFGNLSDAMRHINGLYTQEFNRVEQIDGALFRGRYRSILVEEDSYLLQVSRYIHLNPVSAGIIKKPQDYPWSSYKHYISQLKLLPWLHTDFIQDIVSMQNKEAGYQLFVNEGIDVSTKYFYDAKKIPAVFGNKAFKNDALSKIPKDKIKYSKPDYNRTYEPPSLTQIFQICAKYFNLSQGELLHYQKGKMNVPRHVAMYMSRVTGNATLENIAKFYGCKTKSGPSNAVCKINSLLHNHQEIKEQIIELQTIINETAANNRC